MATQINYTDEQTADLVNAYDRGNGKTVEELAQETGRSAKSIIAKLVKEQVYVPKAKPSTEKNRTKAQLAVEISEAIGSTRLLESLEKCAKEDLLALANHFSELRLGRVIPRYVKGE